MIPEINKKYNCFNDGKIRESRRYETTVKEIIPFKEIDEDTLKQWTREIKSCYWLYRKDTDYFIKTINSDNEEEVFVRTIKNGWFSMGDLFSGRLDVDGKLTEIAKLENENY